MNAKVKAHEPICKKCFDADKNAMWTLPKNKNFKAFWSIVEKYGICDECPYTLEHIINAKQRNL